MNRNHEVWNGGLRRATAMALRDLLWSAMIQWPNVLASHPVFRYGDFGRCVEIP
jgi:hypothetical protein